MKRVAVVTSTRAEYGLLLPVLYKIVADDSLEQDLIVTGSHLSDLQGHTIDKIISDGLDVSHIVPINEPGDNPYDVSLTISNAIRGFAKCFVSDRPDILIILGDRTEILGVAIAAINECIPIAHIHGGEVTKGAIDDSIRHALTKMSYLHFTSTDIYRKRVIQMGESPDRVFNVGALGVENALSLPLMSKEEIMNDLGIPTGSPYAVLTYHPVTMELDSIESDIQTLKSIIWQHPEYFFVITGANNDASGLRINNAFKKLADDSDNIRFYISLGTQRYLSAIKYASFVLGNSSSGILEAPVFGTPVINIGNRQKGRICPPTVINCHINVDEIRSAIKEAQIMPHKPSHIYGDGHTSEKILDIIKRFLYSERIDQEKGFFDLPS